MSYSIPHSLHHHHDDHHHQLVSTLSFRFPADVAYAGYQKKRPIGVGVILHLSKDAYTISANATVMAAGSAQAKQPETCALVRSVSLLTHFLSGISLCRTVCARAFLKFILQISACIFAQLSHIDLL